MGKRGLLVLLGVLIFLSLAASSAFAGGGAASGAVREAIHRMLRQMTREELAQIERAEVENGWRAYADKQLLRYLGSRVEQGETRALNQEVMSDLKETLSSPEALDRYIRSQGLLEAIEEGASQVVYQEILGAVSRLARRRARSAVIQTQGNLLRTTQEELWGRIDQAVSQEANIRRFMDPLFQEEVAVAEMVVGEADRFVTFENFLDQFLISAQAYHRQPEQTVALLVKEGGFRLSDETMFLSEREFFHRLFSDAKPGLELRYFSKETREGVIVTIEVSHQTEGGLVIKETLHYFEGHLSSRRLMAGQNVIHEEAFGELVSPY